MVMRDLAVDMVSDVGLRDAVGTGGTNPGHNGSEVTKEIAIVGRQGTTGEGELARTIMWEEGVSVLQERDQHEPVIDPEIRKKIGAQDLEESKPIDRVVQASEPK